MLVSGLRGVSVHGPRLSERYGDLAQLGVNLSGLGALPGDVRWFIKERRPENPHETDWLVGEKPDGFMRIPDFYGRWSAAVAISNEVDQIRGDPYASALNSKETAYANAMYEQFDRARNYYPWGQTIGGRISYNQQMLDAALGRIDALLGDYLVNIKALLAQTRRQIEERESARADREVAVEHASKAAAIAAAKASEKTTAVDEGLRAVASKDAFTAKKDELVAQLDLETLVKKVQAPKIFGIPVAVVVPVALAGAVGVVLMVRKKRAAQLAGYRRRRVRRRTKR